MCNIADVHRIDSSTVLASIATPREFHFGEILTYMSRSGNESLFRVHEEAVHQLIALGECPTYLRIDCPLPGTLRVLVQGAGQSILEDAVLQEALRYVRNWFDLDRDLQPFYTMAQQDPILRDLVQAFYGLRIVGIEDLFEAFSWAIIGQQINLTFAYTLKRRLVETFGTAMEHDGWQYSMFPTAKRIASLACAELTALQFSQKKAEYLINIASHIASGQLTKQRLLEIHDFDAVEKVLIAIRGIGPWTANYVAMRCLRNPRAFPVADVGLQNAVKARLGMDRKPTQTELVNLGAAWRGWEAYATFYLWRSLQGLSA